MKGHIRERSPGGQLSVVESPETKAGLRFKLPKSGKAHRTKEGRSRP
jgi:hypothetical protein